MSETRRQADVEQDLEDLEEDRRQALLAAAADKRPTIDAWNQVKRDTRDQLADDEED